MNFTSECASSLQTHQVSRSVILLLASRSSTHTTFSTFANFGHILFQLSSTILSHWLQMEMNHSTMQRYNMVVAQILILRVINFCAIALLHSCTKDFLHLKKTRLKNICFSKRIHHCRPIIVLLLERRYVLRQVFPSPFHSNYKLDRNCGARRSKKACRPS